MFFYDPNHADPLSRCRFQCGDITAPGYMPDETYTAAIARYTTTTTGDDGTAITAIDEEAATRTVARGLAAFYATQPDSISDAGSRISWGKRVEQWNRIAEGKAGGGKTRPKARGFKLERGPARDYTTGGGDAR